MKNNNRKIYLKGPVLLLMGPIGLFFSRFANYLNKNNIDVYKLMLPLYEFGFSKEQIIFYSGTKDQYKDFLKGIIV